MSISQEFIDALCTPEGIWDVRLVLAHANFPIYILKPGAVNPQLIHLAPRVRWSQDEGTRISCVHCEYCSPSLAWIDQAVAMQNGRKWPHMPPIDDIAIVNTLHSIRGLWPRKYEPPFDWGSLNTLWKSRDSDDGTDDGLWESRPVVQLLRHHVLWETHTPNTNGLTFTMFHWDEPAQVSLASCEDDENGLLTIVALGMSRGEFTALLAEVIRLKPHDRLIDQLQNDLRTATKERERLWQQQHGT